MSDLRLSPSGRALALTVTGTLVIPAFAPGGPPVTVTVAAPGILPTDGVVLCLLGGALSFPTIPLPGLVCTAPGVVSVVIVDSLGAGDPGGTFPVLFIAFRP
jgi:hypothetical protein